MSDLIRGKQLILSGWSVCLEFGKVGDEVERRRMGSKLARSHAPSKLGRLGTFRLLRKVSSYNNAV